MSFETLQHNRLIWTNIIEPTLSDISRLGYEHPNFHPLNLEDCLSRIERPKLDEYEDSLFIVMHFPVWDSERRVSRPSEVDFFVGQGYVVTVHDGELQPLVNLFEQCKNSEEARDRLLVNQGQFLHTTVDRLVDYIFPILYKVDANIRTIEETMFDEDMRRTIQDISFTRRDIVALRRIIRPQLPIVFNLEQVERPFIRSDLDLEVYFGDILDHLQKARDIMDDNAELIANLADTVDAIAAHRVNEVIRILTVTSLVLLPLEIVVGFMGMNVLLPLQDNPYASPIIIAVMVGVVVGLLAYFRHKHWL